MKNETITLSITEFNNIIRLSTYIYLLSLENIYIASTRKHRTGLSLARKVYLYADKLQQLLGDYKDVK